MGKGSRQFVRVGMLGLAALSVSLAGCEKKAEPPPPPPPRPTGPPPPPPPVSLTSVRPAGLDARVSFEQAHAPVDGALARGIFTLADSLAKKDAQRLNAILNRAGKDVLVQVRSAWDELEIEAVRVVYVDEAARTSADISTSTVVLAVKSTNHADPNPVSGAIVLVWNAEKLGDSWVFGPRVSSSQVRTLATDWDGRTMGEYAGTEFGLPPELEALLSMPFVPPMQDAPSGGQPRPRTPRPDEGPSSPGGPAGG
ncbi:MAG: hypothetical protein KF866_09535 [Phycisphaeraceae bacterium]|nr:hypothetical protein [Phycisphaeraceae bacterium]MCW5754739.1 hypothetical protein [Phycisphaeraceae bacterium]